MGDYTPQKAILPLYKGGYLGGGGGMPPAQATREGRIWLVIGILPPCHYVISY